MKKHYASLTKINTNFVSNSLSAIEWRQQLILIYLIRKYYYFVSNSVSAMEWRHFYFLGIREEREMR